MGLAAGLGRCRQLHDATTVRTHRRRWHSTTRRCSRRDRPEVRSVLSCACGHLCGPPGLVGDQAPVDGVRQPALQAPQRFLDRLVLGQLAPVVGLPGAGTADLHDRHHVQGVVQLAVTGPRQPVADDLAAGGLQGGGAGVGGEVALAEDLGFGRRAAGQPCSIIRVTSRRLPCKVSLALRCAHPAR